MLTDRITLFPTSAPLEAEDYLSTSLGVIFPDDITNQHGDPSTPVIYTSPAFGKIFLSFADPVGEDSRRLFAQYLWNAGVYVAVGIEDVLTESASSSSKGGGAGDGLGSGMGGEMGAGMGTGKDRGEGKEKDPWDVQHETVLELGAGTGLAGIIAAKAGAKEVVITDYPAEEVLVNLRGNVERNLGPEERERCCVRGHEWGVVPGFHDSRKPYGHDEVVDSAAKERPEGEANSAASQDISFPAPHHARHFSRLLVADCLWLPSQHSNLHASIAYFLSSHGYALVVAGFHTGRAKMAGFFDADALAAVGLEVQSIVEKDPVGRERAWRASEGGKAGERGAGRDGHGNPADGGEGREDLSERKRWLVVAALRRRGEVEGG